MTEVQHTLTAALGPIERRLDGIERRQIAQGGPRRSWNPVEASSAKWSAWIAVARASARDT